MNVKLLLIAARYMCAAIDARDKATSGRRVGCVRSLGETQAHLSVQACDRTREYINIVCAQLVVVQMLILGTWLCDLFVESRVSEIERIGEAPRETERRYARPNSGEVR